MADIASKNPLVPTHNELFRAQDWVRTMRQMKDITQTMYSGSTLGRSV